MLEIKSKHEILKINEDHKHEYGCLMGFFNKSFENPSILSDDVYNDEPGYGMESEPHVTILFGLHHNELELEQLYDYLYHKELFDITTKKISSFENDYDVLKWEVEKSDEIMAFNEYIATTYPNTQNFPNYEPHITIAYLKKGKAAKYVQDLPMPLKKRIDFWVYSMPNRKKIKIVPGVSIETYAEAEEQYADVEVTESCDYDTVKNVAVFENEVEGVQNFIIPFERFFGMYTVRSFENKVYKSGVKGFMSLDDAKKMINV